MTESKKIFSRRLNYAFHEVECAYCARDYVNGLLAQTNHGKRKYCTTQFSSQTMTWFECPLKLGFTAASVRKRNRPAPRPACFIRLVEKCRRVFLNYYSGV